MFCAQHIRLSVSRYKVNGYPMWHAVACLKYWIAGNPHYHYVNHMDVDRDRTWEIVLRTIETSDSILCHFTNSEWSTFRLGVVGLVDYSKRDSWFNVEAQWPDNSTGYGTLIDTMANHGDLGSAEDPVDDIKGYLQHSMHTMTQLRNGQGTPQAKGPRDLLDLIPF